MRKLCPPNRSAALNGAAGGLLPHLLASTPAFQRGDCNHPKGYCWFAVQRRVLVRKKAPRAATPYPGAVDAGGAASGLVVAQQQNRSIHPRQWWRLKKHDEATDEAQEALMRATLERLAWLEQQGRCGG